MDQIPGGELRISKDGDDQMGAKSLGIPTKTKN